MKAAGQKHASIPKDYWTHWTRHIKVEDDIFDENMDTKSVVVDLNTPLLSPEESELPPIESLSHLWQFLAFIVISISSIFIWNYTGPVKLPWFTIVIGFFMLVWAFYKWTPKLMDTEMEPKKKKQHQLTLHAMFQAILNFVCLSYYTFGPFQKDNPWFIFVLLGSALCLVVHYTVSFIDLKRKWVLPQLYIYLIACAATFFVWYFYDKRNSNWFVWPISIWGSLIGVQVIVFVIRTKRKEKQYLDIKKAMEKEAADLANLPVRYTNVQSGIYPISIHPEGVYGLYKMGHGPYNLYKSPQDICFTPQDDMAVSCSTDDVNYVEYINSA